MDKISLPWKKKLLRTLRSLQPPCPHTELCIPANLKTVDAWLRCLYKTAGSSEAMTDGSTCGTKVIWTDGWRDEWTDRWMEEWRKADRDDKWAEDECRSPSRTTNTWPSKPQRWQHNLCKDTGSTLHPVDGRNSSMVMSGMFEGSHCCLCSVVFLVHCRSATISIRRRSHSMTVLQL